MLRYLCNSCVILFGIISIIASGGGGGNGTGGDGGSSSQDTKLEEEVILNLDGPGDTDNYFPLDLGNYWHYEGLQDNILAYHNSLSISGTKDINGSISQILLETNTYGEGPASETYYVKDPNGVANFGSDTTGDPTSGGDLPFWELRFPLTIDDHFVQLDREGISFGEDLDGDAIDETYDIYSEVTVEAEENISVPAGNFQNVFKLRRDVEMSVYLSSDNTIVPSTATENAWYAPDLGLVKRNTTISIENETATASEELDVYQVAGGSFGITNLLNDSHQDTVQLQESNVYIYPATKWHSYLVSIIDLNGDADLIPYLPDNCEMALINRPGNQTESYTAIAIDERIAFAVKGIEQSDYKITINAVTNIITPVNEGEWENPVLIQANTPTIGQVATRGESYYAATGLSLGDYTVSITALSADADLHIYTDNTYSIEQDCTLWAPGDTGNSSEECTVTNSDEIYFSVSSGELNRDGATYFILVTGS